MLSVVGATRVAAAPAARRDGWRAHPGALRRFVVDLMIDETARLRPGGVPLPMPPWTDDLALEATAAGVGLGLDSLERLAVAAALTEALHLGESGIEDQLLARRRFGEWLEIAAAGLRQFDTRLTFRTSGSSGTPKACSHQLATLEQEVEHLAGLLGGTRRVLAAVPAHHIYGFLFTVLLPARLNCGAALDVRQVTPQVLRQMLRPGDLLVSHPAHWALLAAHVAMLPAGVVGVTSTAPCPDPLARALAARGLQRLLQVYGSSETAGIGWRDEPGAPYRLMPFWSHDAAADARLQRRAPDGALAGHLPPDRLAWHDDGRFSVHERVDAATQVGGINVFPARVRQALLEHPQVADAMVRLMSPDEGDRLKAFIVPVPDSDRAALPATLEAWLRTRLSVPEQPKAFTLGDRLPVTERGKPSNWPVAAAAADAFARAR